MFAEGSLPEHHTLVKKNTSIFCEAFAEGSLPERHTLVLEKRAIFCEVFAEGSLPERHTLVKKHKFSVRCLFFFYPRMGGPRGGGGGSQGKGPSTKALL